MRENARKVEVSVVLEAQVLRGLFCGAFYLRKRGASFPPVANRHPKTTLTSKKRALSRTRNGTPGQCGAREPVGDATRARRDGPRARPSHGYYAWVIDKNRGAALAGWPTRATHPSGPKSEPEVELGLTSLAIGRA